MRSKVGSASLYAYGASAGGALAGILSGAGLVRAAAAKAPPSNLLVWHWPVKVYGQRFYQRIQADGAVRQRFSWLARQQRHPLLIFQGQQDPVVPARMSKAFAAKFPRVQLWLVPGGHATDHSRPWEVNQAMHWLSNQAHPEHQQPLAISLY